MYFPNNKEINLLHPEAQKLFRNLTENVKSGVYMADEKGNLFFVNQAFVNMLGYTQKEELLGKNLADELYADPKEREEFLKNMRKIGFVRDYVVRNVRKDGSIALLSATSNFIRDTQGEVVGVEGVVRDITEHVKLEESIN